MMIPCALTKSMKLGANENLDKALYVWFTQKRMEGIPISGPMLENRSRDPTQTYMMMSLSRRSKVQRYKRAWLRGSHQVFCLSKFMHVQRSDLHDYVQEARRVSSSTLVDRLSGRRSTSVKSINGFSIVPVVIKLECAG